VATKVMVLKFKDRLKSFEEEMVASRAGVG
jgi:hypothetical protein